MKRILAITIVLFSVLLLSGCALTEFLENNDTVVDLSDGETAVKWVLVENDNECRPVESAYFEFGKDSFKYYENGMLKKEGTHSITYFDINTSNSPLHLNLEFGKDESGFSVFDYIDCYTEDAKEDLHQFTIVSEGYHIKPIRSGGVPVRDYHLSDMPYALGTYVKEGAEAYEYENGRVNYLGCARLNGKFYDESGNSFYFVNNSYTANYKSSDYSKYTVYVRYENKLTGTFVEGTIKLSYFEDFDTKEPHNVALIYVMHGESEPGAESGTYAEADYELMDFNFENDNTVTFTAGSYFYDNRECRFDPSNFLAGAYCKMSED